MPSSHLRPRSAGVLLGLALPLLGLSALVSAQQSAPPPTQPRIEEHLSELTMRALLAPQQEATLSSRMEGTLDELAVSLGATVAEGDVLARFDCRIEQARVNVANTELGVARLNSQAKDRLRRLDAVGDLEVALARAEVDKAQSALNLAAVQRDRCTLKAPFAGRIAAVHVKPFQTMAAGTPIVDLVGDGPLKVRLNAPSAQLAELGEGQPLSLEVNETGQRYAATLSALSARIDAVAQTVELEARLNQAHDELMPGMTGRATLVAESPATEDSDEGTP